MIYLAIFVFLIFTCIQITDIITTIMIINGGGYEANPIMAWVMKSIGTLAALLLSKAILILLFFYSLYISYNNPLYLILYITFMSLGIIFYLKYVIFHNLNQIHLND